VTTLYTTRDAVEAAAVSDRVALIDNGRLVEISPAARLRSQPATVQAAAEFDPTLVVGTARVDGLPFAAPTDDGTVTVAFPPGAARLVSHSGLSGRVLAAEASTVYVAVAGFDDPVPVEVEGPGVGYVGLRVYVHIDAEAVQFFDARTGLRLS
jgi:ABC-type sugar transport system ATPase subunit